MNHKNESWDQLSAHPLILRGKSSPEWDAALGLTSCHLCIFPSWQLLAACEVLICAQLPHSPFGSCGRLRAQEYITASPSCYAQASGPSMRGDGDSTSDGTSLIPAVCVAESPQSNLSAVMASVQPDASSAGTNLWLILLLGSSAEGAGPPSSSPKGKQEQAEPGQVCGYLCLSPAVACARAAEQQQQSSAPAVSSSRHRRAWGH